jgi:hypothetical protein
MNGKQTVEQKVADLKSAVGQLFKVQHGFLIEAVARAYGYNTFAAACVDQEEKQRVFDEKSFHRRYSELDSERMACAYAALARGFRLTIDLKQFGSGDGSIAIFQANVKVEGKVPALSEFYLPSRIPSRFVNDRTFGDRPLYGFLRNGLWSGQLYAPNTTKDLKWGKSAISRSVLASLY